MNTFTPSASAVAGLQAERVKTRRTPARMGCAILRSPPLTVLEKCPQTGRAQRPRSRSSRAPEWRRPSRWHWDLAFLSLARRCRGFAAPRGRRSARGRGRRVGEPPWLSPPRGGEAAAGARRPGHPPKVGRRPTRERALREDARANPGPEFVPPRFRRLDGQPAKQGSEPFLAVQPLLATDAAVEVAGHSQDLGLGEGPVQVRSDPPADPEAAQPHQRDLPEFVASTVG